MPKADRTLLSMRFFVFTPCMYFVMAHAYQVMMPSGGAAFRAHQKTALAGVLHEKKIDPGLGDLLHKLQKVRGAKLMFLRFVHLSFFIIYGEGGGGGGGVVVIAAAAVEMGAHVIRCAFVWICVNVIRLSMPIS